MTSVKANTSRFSFHRLSLALCCVLLNSAVAIAQENPEEYPPWANDDDGWTDYNYPVGIDVLSNDYVGSLPIDSSTLTVVSQPASGAADVDPVLGLIVYTPDENFAGYDQFEYQVADTAGNLSNVATVGVWVHNEAPYITLNYYQETGNIWVFFGDVTDENPGVCKVRFGGILDGKTCEVDQYGQYQLYVEMATGAIGIVTAQTTDEIGEDSNIAQDYFYQY